MFALQELLIKSYAKGDAMELSQRLSAEENTLFQVWLPMTKGPVSWIHTQRG